MQLDARLVCLVVPTARSQAADHSGIPRPVDRRPANNYVVYHAHNHGVCDSMSWSICHARNSSAVVLIHRVWSLRYKIELRLVRCVCDYIVDDRTSTFCCISRCFYLRLANRRRSSARPIRLGFSVSTEHARRLLGGRSCTVSTLLVDCGRITRTFT